MKSRLANIVTGEYISSPMINFLSGAIVEQQDNFASAVFRGKGIISAFDTDGNYDTSLRVIAGTNNNIVVQAGAFVANNGKVVAVPQTSTKIGVNQTNKIFIRYRQSIYLPDVTINGTAGALSITYSDNSILDYICPGMAILTESMFNQGIYTGMKIAAVGSSITVDSAIPNTFANERVIILPKFVNGISNLDSSCVYRFDSYEIVDEASLTSGQAIGTDWILLATVDYSDGQFQINNVRATSADEIGIDVTSAIFPYIPNVASVATVFSDNLQYMMKKFFIDGRLQIGEEEKDIFGHSHEQNTDEGTTNAYFDILKDTPRKFRIGDAGDVQDFLIRLYSDAVTRRDYELPNGESTDTQNTNVNLIAKQVPEELQAMFSFKPVDVLLTAGTLNLNSTSNVFVVSGSGELRNIVVNGRASTFLGQPIILKCNSKVTICLGGNIVSNFITQSMSQDNAFVVEAGETIALINIGYSYFILSSSITAWKRVLEVNASLQQLSQTVTGNYHAFENYIQSATTRFENIEQRLTDDEALIAQNTANIETNRNAIVVANSQIGAHTTMIENINTRLDDQDTRINDNATMLQQHATQLQTHTTQITNLTTRVQNCEQAISQHVTRLNNHDSRITALESWRNSFDATAFNTMRFDLVIVPLEGTSGSGLEGLVVSSQDIKSVLVRKGTYTITVPSQFVNLPIYNVTQLCNNNATIVFEPGVVINVTNTVAQSQYRPIFGSTAVAGRGRWYLNGAVINNDILQAASHINFFTGINNIQDALFKSTINGNQIMVSGKNLSNLIDITMPPDSTSYLSGNIILYINNSKNVTRCTGRFGFCENLVECVGIFDAIYKAYRCNGDFSGVSQMWEGPTCPFPPYVKNMNVVRYVLIGCKGDVNWAANIFSGYMNLKGNCFNVWMSFGTQTGASNYCALGTVPVNTPVKFGSDGTEYAAIVNYFST